MGMSKGGGKGSVGVGWPVRVLAWCAFLVLAGSFWMLYFYEISHGTDEGEEEIWSGFKEDLTWRLRTLADFITITNAFTINLFFWWVMPLTATLASIILLQIPNRMAILRPFGYIKRFLSFEFTKRFLPFKYTKRFPGLTIGEAVGILMWLSMNATTFVKIYHNRFDYMVQAQTDDPYPEWAQRFHSANFAIGYICFVNFTLVLFPVSRVSPMFDFVGLSYEKRIKYHRFLASISLIVVTFHGMLFWLLWVIRGEWQIKAVEWGRNAVTAIENSLAGAISLGFGIAMWISSHSYIRRNYFEVFYKTHIIGFVGFVIFANIHVPGFYNYMTGALLLYLVDVILRTTQMSFPVAVDSAEINSDSTITSISVKAPKGTQACSIPTIWVSCPSISGVQWHPCTPYISADGKMTFSFKSYGNWTKGLAAEAVKGTLDSLLIEGPHDLDNGGLYEETVEYDSLMLMAGGIACVMFVWRHFQITPVLGLLQALDNGYQRRLELHKGAVIDLPLVHVVWTVRNTSELEVGLPKLAEFSKKYPGVLTLQTYVTGKTDSGKRQVPQIASRSRQNWWKIFKGPTSPMLLPAYRGPLHLALMYIVSYGAGFTGYLLGNAWFLNYFRVNGTFQIRWKINIITFICIMFMAIGWVTLVVLPIYIITVVQASRAAEGEKQNTAKQHLQVSEDNTILQDFNDSRHLGRPEFSRILQTFAADLSPNAKAVVIAGGPARMVTSVKEACDVTNLKFHEASFEL